MIVDAAKRAALQADGPLSRSDFERLTGIGQYFLYKLFPEGGWSEVKRAAGLERHPKANKLLSDDELLAEFHRVASELGKVPTWHVFASHARFSIKVIGKRFGGMQGTLTHYRDWLESHFPTSPLLEQLQAKITNLIPITSPIAQTTTAVPWRNVWSKNDGPLFGPPIDFRGLRHAPINEQGVVFLFGMLSYELGFIVEAIHAAYPDCEAKRCVDRKSQRWQKVSIEFEFLSRNFKEHGHDPDGCDVIVCWEHNWPECPIEVVELRRAIGGLEE